MTAQNRVRALSDLQFLGDWDQIALRGRRRYFFRRAS